MKVVGLVFVCIFFRHVYLVLPLIQQQTGMINSFRQRLYSDQRTTGSLIHTCGEEVEDLTLVEAMQRLTALLVAKISSTGEFAEDVVGKMIDAMMGTAVEFMQTIRSMHNRNLKVITS